MDVFYAEYQRLVADMSDIQESMPFLFETARELGGPIIELGTRGGRSTSALLAGLESSNLGGDLWSVDIGDIYVPAWWHTYPLWHFLHADDMSTDAQEWLPAEVPVLFIDTSHTYDHTLAELRTYVPRVKPGGKVLMHDTMWSKEGKEQQFPDGPVTDALNTYCKEEGITWENRGGDFGLGVISIG